MGNCKALGQRIQKLFFFLDVYFLLDSTQKFSSNTYSRVTYQNLNSQLNYQVNFQKKFDIARVIFKIFEKWIVFKFSVPICIFWYVTRHDYKFTTGDTKIWSQLSKRYTTQGKKTLKSTGQLLSTELECLKKHKGYAYKPLT